MSSSNNDNFLFTLENVQLLINNNQILEDINVNIEQGSVTGIIGPSGSGKSSFLKLLNKLYSPTNGTIFFQGKDINELSTQNLRKDIGMVQQRPFLFPGTVRYNLEYGPKLWKINYSENDLINLLEKVALPTDFLDRNIEGLSGGEQQRVSLARILANKPSVLLLDEPTSSLDLASEEIFESTLKELISDGIKVIIVTHSLDQTKRLTDKLLFLKEGKLIEKSTTDEFFEKYNLEEIRSFFKKKEDK